MCRRGTLCAPFMLGCIVTHMKRLYSTVIQSPSLLSTLLLLIASIAARGLRVLGKAIFIYILRERERERERESRDEAVDDGAPEIVQTLM